MSLSEERREDRGDILVPGETCWRIARADRLSVIVDAASYFAHLREALQAARRTVYLVGWDFDLRLEMLPGQSDAEGLAPDGMPNQLGDFLQHIVKASDGVSLHILKWDKAMLLQLAQQAPETLALKMASDRIHFALDSHHPTGATHHQKIVVIDDRLAFCGGIDVTGGRWDTSEHAPDNPRRVLPDGTPHQPWHDVTTAVSGPAAAVLGDLARMRWKAATGEELTSPDISSDPWPSDLDMGLEDTDVAVARTSPDYDGDEKIDEIEQLYVAAIRAARRTIYLESQYFASAAICRVLEARLSEPDGPELLVINPESADGPVESAIMDTARDRMIELVGEADRADRFRIYYPVNEAGDPIYVHAKVLIVDDALIRIGSSNVNNRSMGFDTECDLAVECTDETQRAFARKLRNSLMAEHLDCTAEDVEREIEASGSLLAAVDALVSDTGRRLVRIDPISTEGLHRAAADRILFDERAHPRNRPRPVRAVTHAAKRATAPYQIEAAGIGTILLGAAVLGLGVWGALRLARRRKSEALAAPAILRPEPHAPKTMPPATDPERTTRE